MPSGTEDLGYFDVIGDAFRLENPVGAAIKASKRDIDPEAEFDAVQKALDDNIGPEYLDSFVYVDNEAEYAEAVSDIEKDLQAKQRLSEAGVSGFLASMTAAVASPSAFIGAGTAINLFKAGTNITKSALLTGAATGTVVKAEEELLQATQAGRTDEEVNLNILGSVILGGLGGGFGAKISKVRLDKQADALKQLLQAQENVGKFPEKLSEFLEFNDSLSAARTSQEELFETEGLSALSRKQLGLKEPEGAVSKAIFAGWKKINKLWNPAVRFTTSRSRAAREYYFTSADASLKPQAVEEGFAIPESLEGFLKRRQIDYAQQITKFQDTFSAYKKSKGKLNNKDFRAEVGRAFHLEEPHPDKFVEQAKNDFAKFYEDIAEELIELKIMPEDIRSPKEGAKYLNRVWKTKAIEADIPKFKATITPYLRRQLTSISNRLKNTAQEVDASGKPTKEALEAREEFNKFFADEQLFEDYLKESVNSVTNNLLKVNDIGSYTPVTAGAKGPLKQRSFNIPDNEIIDYLDTDILFLSHRYHRQVMPEIGIKKKFGDKTLDDILTDIKKEYDAIEERAGPAKAKALLKEKEEVLRDVEITWNLLRGTYKGVGGSVDNKMRRASEALLLHNYLVSLGGVVVSSVPDMAMQPLRRGFANAYGKSLTPFIKDIFKTGGRMSRTEARSYGQAFEHMLSLRTQSLYSIGDPMAFGSGFERAIGVLGNKMSNVNLINQWNDTWQTLASLGTRARIVSNVENFLAKGKIIKAEEEWMNFMGISKSDRIKFAESIEQFGTKDPNGNTIPNVDKWADKESAKKFISAVSKEVDRTVITKGVSDIPRFGNTTLGRIMFQWQNFNFAFNNKVIGSSLQEADGRIALGFGGLVTAGMLTEYLKTLGTKQELPDNSAAWVEAGLDRSGVLGLVAYGNSFLEVGGLSYKELVGEEPRRPSDALETILGPSGRTLKNAGILAGSIRPIAEGRGFTDKDLHRLRTTLGWGQNVFWLKGILDKIEKEVAEDLPEKRKPKK
jgi:hypothetical protein